MMNIFKESCTHNVEKNYIPSETMYRKHASELNSYNRIFKNNYFWLKITKKRP